MGHTSAEAEHGRKPHQRSSKEVPPGTPRLGDVCDVPVDACSNGVACIFWRIVMKTFVSALIALSVLAGVAAPANAFDAKSLYEQLDRQSS